MNASMNGDQLFAMEIIKWLVILCVALSIPTTIIGVVAFWRTQTGAAKTFSVLIERGSIGRLAAIFAIIFSTFKQRGKPSKTADRSINLQWNCRLCP